MKNIKYFLKIYIFWKLEIINNNKKTTIKIDDAFFFSIYNEKGLKKSILPKQPLMKWDLSKEKIETNLISIKLPILYGDISKNQFNDTDINLGLDIFGSSFFMLSRLEEIFEIEKDNHERFSSDKSIAYNENFLKRPIVDEYIEILKSLIKIKEPNFKFKKNNFKTVVSHDVDVPTRYGFSNFGIYLKRSLVDTIKGKKLSILNQSFKIRKTQKLI